MIFDYNYPGAPQPGFGYLWSGGDALAPVVGGASPWRRIGLPLSYGMGI